MPRESIGTARAEVTFFATKKVTKEILSNSNAQEELLPRMLEIPRLGSPVETGHGIKVPRNSSPLKPGRIRLPATSAIAHAK